MTIHEEVFARIQSLLEDEDDWVSAMSTVVCELHNSFDHFHWTGFYRTVQANLLKIGPYQGGHGCLATLTKAFVGRQLEQERHKMSDIAFKT